MNTGDNIPRSAYLGKTSVIKSELTHNKKDFIQKNGSKIIMGAVLIALASATYTGVLGAQADSGNSSINNNSGIQATYEKTELDKPIDWSSIGEGTEIAETAAFAAEGKTVKASSDLSNDLLGAYDLRTNKYVDLSNASVSEIRELAANPDVQFEFGEITDEGEMISEGWVSNETVGKIIKR